MNHACFALAGGLAGVKPGEVCYISGMRAAENIKRARAMIKPYNSFNTFKDSTYDTQLAVEYSRVLTYRWKNKETAVFSALVAEIVMGKMLDKGQVSLDHKTKKINWIDTGAEKLYKDIIEIVKSPDYNWQSRIHDNDD